MTALISVNGAVAALIPVVVVVATRAGHPPSQMLHAARVLGPRGVVARAHGHAGEHHRERSGSGCRCAAVRLLRVRPRGRAAGGGHAADPRRCSGAGCCPSAAPTTLPQDVSEHARTLREQYALPEGTELIGVRAAASTEVVVAPRSRAHRRCTCSREWSRRAATWSCSPCSAAGRTSSGADARCAAGDTLLLSGGWDELQRNTAGPDVLVVDDPARMRRCGAARARARSGRSSILAAMVAAAGHGPRAAGDRRAGRGIRSGADPGRDARRRPTEASRGRRSCSSAGMIPLSTAFITTGTADVIATAAARPHRRRRRPTWRSPRCACSRWCSGSSSRTRRRCSSWSPIAVVARGRPGRLGAAVHDGAHRGGGGLLPHARSRRPRTRWCWSPAGTDSATTGSSGSPCCCSSCVVAVLYVPLVWPF